MNSSITDFITVLAIGLAAVVIDKARADTPPTRPTVPAGEQHRSVMGSGALQGATGRVATNQAAGHSNLQSNQAVMAVGAQAAAHNSAEATVQGPLSIDPSATYSAQIESKAMASVSGLVSINQASGAGNAQINLTTVVVGEPIGEVGDAKLSHAAPQARTGLGATPTRAAPVVGIASDALANSRGVLQLNQVAGGGNASSTELTVRVAPLFR